MSALSPLQIVLQGGRNGALYATKIRFVDGCVKALLYSRSSALGALTKVLDDTIEHASSLGGFAFLYKAFVLALESLCRRRWFWHPAAAGFVGGAVMWGRRSQFNEMINLYVFSRVCFALAQSSTRSLPSISFPMPPFRLWAAVVWALVMVQFESGAPLQPSLAASMRYLYRDSDIGGIEGWKRHLGRGAKFVPTLSMLVVAVRLLIAGLARKSPLVSGDLPRVPSDSFEQLLDATSEDASMDQLEE
eukprot:TRINITY_DN62574_c0_g1_i1.p1 TRINITY_DN62574_c0_g1~~TRINITY_DN62574_c0_g1_i1.p1  ORF type:complete len:247 (-),score=39.56 TRINITY_DN62574_c0_g1_i1:84-824(-)